VQQGALGCKTSVSSSALKSRVAASLGFIREEHLSRRNLAQAKASLRTVGMQETCAFCAAGGAKHRHSSVYSSDRISRIRKGLGALSTLRWARTESNSVIDFAICGPPSAAKNKAREELLKRRTNCERRGACAPMGSFACDLRFVELGGQFGLAHTQMESSPLSLRKDLRGQMLSIRIYRRRGDN